MDAAARQHERIKVRLRLADSSLALIARELGVAPTTVSTVSKGSRRSRRIEEAIAGKLGETPATLWPKRYGKKATSNSSKPSARGSR